MTQLAEGARLTGHSGNDEIGTPKPLFNWLERRFQFNYDAAASHVNALTTHYSTSEGTPRGHGNQLTMDGLTYPWANWRVFVNPPYSTALMRAFVEKAIEERNNAEIIVMLVKYDPSTATGRLLDDRRYFHLEQPMRVKFDGMTSASTFPVVVAIVKPDPWRAGK